MSKGLNRMRLSPLVCLAAALTLPGCGGGGSASGSGRLNFQATWEQQNRTAPAASAEATADRAQAAHGSFGPSLPAAIKTVRIIFTSAPGRRCCLAVNPTSLPTDPASGRGVLVLAALPAGAASVTLAGFATGFAPADGAITDTCPTDPDGAGQPCDTAQQATPSCVSDPHPVTIVEGLETNAGEIEAFAVPFLLAFDPGQGSSRPSPVTITATVVDAVTGVEGQSVSIDVSQSGRPAGSSALTLTSCNDATANPCSPGGQLGVNGVRVTRGAQGFNVGSADVHIAARNLAAPARNLDFDYAFRVTSAIEATPVPTPSGIIIVRSGHSIVAAIRRAPAGGVLVAAPGVYEQVTLRQGDLRGPITLLADVTGSITQTAAAPVVINARGQFPAIDVAGVSDLTIDGFTLRGGANAGARIADSQGTTVRNCVVTDTRGDGIRFDRSDGASIFDNLVFRNSGAGIALHGTNDVSVINNTVFGNSGNGIFTGDAANTSNNITVKNNIINANNRSGLAVDASTTGYEGDFNLNTDGYAQGTPVGADDISDSPLFIAPAVNDFHISVGVIRSTSPALDAGDPAIDANTASALAGRSTQTDNSPDIVPVDLGYHYPGAATTPAPTPTPAR